MNDQRGDAGRLRDVDATPVDVVIVNYNTADLLVGTLEDLAEQLPRFVVPRVFVVDNNSHDGSLERVRAGWPDVEIIQMGYNSGFCRANNAGISAGDAEFVLLVNTDTRLRPGVVDAMLRTLRSEPRVAGAGRAAFEFVDGRFQPAATGATPSLWSYLMWVTRLERFADRFPVLEGMWTTRDHGQVRRVGWVCSACMMLRREAVEAIGLMDPRIFLYMDDVDLCHRLGVAGWDTWYLGDTTAVHFMSGGSNRALGSISPYTIESLKVWFDRNHGRGRSILFRALGVIGHGGRVAVLGLAYLLKRRKGPDDVLKDRALIQYHISRYFIDSGVVMPDLDGSAVGSNDESVEVAS